MTNRFPLIIDTVSKAIAELPAGDNLDLSGSDISNVGNITVSHLTNLGDIANVHITGGLANYAIITDGTGNLRWAAQSGGGGGGSETFNPFLLAGM
jgi:hypothetical protein